MVDINNIEELNSFFEEFQQKFQAGEERTAADMLSGLLEDIEKQMPAVKA